MIAAVTMIVVTPPRLPTMFMNPDTIAAYRRPMSWQTAHDGPIVRSLKNPAIATPAANIHMFPLTRPEDRHARSTQPAPVKPITP